MIQITNRNYISKRMQLIDIKGAFGVSHKSIMKFVYDELIGPGYLRKINERYYTPTQKLWDLAFLPLKLLLTEFQVRFLSYNSVFNRTDLVSLFDDNEILVNKLILLNFFKLQKQGVYSKSDNFEEALADGEMQFALDSIPKERG